MTRMTRRTNVRMQSLLVAILAAASGLLMNGASTQAAVPTEAELAAARTWVNGRLQSGDNAPSLKPPISFTYDGRSSAELLAAWPLVQSHETLDNRRERHTLQWTDANTGLVVKCIATTYLDCAAVDWVVTFTNSGTADTPILENIQALDATWQRGGEGEFLLHHGVGSPANGSDYGPLATTLGPDANQRISAAGGRPTNSDLSYFNLECHGRGLIIAVGWPGQWLAEFQRDSGQSIHIRAGQELTRFKLQREKRSAHR